MFPVPLTPEFIECLSDVLNRVTLVAGIGSGAMPTCSTPGLASWSSLDDPATYSPKDPILACFSVGLLECSRDDALTLINHASSRFPRVCPFIAV
jgi:hypothetical protein